MKSTEHTESRWQKTVDSPPLNPLASDSRTEVCVIGAGIAGLTAAYLLAREGREVLVIDRAAVGGGETGHTSAHLSGAMDASFQRLVDVHGAETTAGIHASHCDAIDLIEDIITVESIACDFRRVPGYLFAASDSDVSWLRDEQEAASSAKVSGVSWIDQFAEFGSPMPALRFERQAEFHPLRYLHGLAEAAKRAGVRIHTGSEVTGIEEAEGGVRVKTAGSTVTSGHAVVATNYPITLWLGALPRLAAYRTYVIGLRFADAEIPRALYWDTEDPYHYARLVGSGEEQVLIVGGEDHRTGQETDHAHHFTELEGWIRARLPNIGEVVDRWSGQFLETPDGIGYLGAQPGSERVHVITGDCGQGLTNGTVGAMVVRDRIIGVENRAAEIFRPSRSVLKAPLETVKENFSTLSQYADLVFRSDVDDENAIEPGTGAVLREGHKPVAVYRDDQGVLHRRSAVCTHLGCVVRWNQVESSWDCPCHGSRFGPQGAVLTGPAVEPLAEADE